MKSHPGEKRENKCLHAAPPSATRFKPQHVYECVSEEKQNPFVKQQVVA